MQLLFLLTIILQKEVILERLIYYTLDYSPLEKIQDLIIKYYLHNTHRRKKLILEMIKNEDLIKHNDMHCLLTKLQAFTFSSNFTESFIFLKYLLIDFFKNVETEIYDEINKSELLTTNKSEELIKYYADVFYTTMQRNLLKLKNGKDKFCFIDNLIYDLKYQDVNFYIKNEKKWIKFDEINSKYDLKDMLINNTDIRKVDYSVFFDPEKLINNILELVKADENQKSKRTIVLNFNADLFFLSVMLNYKTFEIKRFFDYIAKNIISLCFNKQFIDKKSADSVINIIKTYNVNFYVTKMKSDYLYYFFHFLNTEIFKTNCRTLGKITDEIFETQQNMQMFTEKLFKTDLYEQLKIKIVSSSN